MEMNVRKSSDIINIGKVQKRTSDVRRSSAGKPVARGHSGRRLKARKIINYRKKDKAPFPMAFVLGIVTLTVLLLLLMMNYAEVDRYNGSIADLKSQLTDLQKEADKLEQRLDRKDDLVYVEEYASEKLGMVKSTDLQRISVTLIDKDNADVYKYDDGDERGLGVLLSGFGRIIRNFFN